MPTPECQDARKAKAKVDAHLEEAISEFPWLAWLDEKEGYTAAGGATPGEGSGGAKRGSEFEVDKTEEETLLRGVCDLEKAKDAVGDAIRPDDAVFAPKVRTPGAGLADAIQGQTRAEGLSWCAGRGLQQTFKVTTSVHGLEAAQICVRAWAHRMQFFYEMELESDEGDALAYSADKIATYE